MKSLELFLKPTQKKLFKMLYKMFRDKVLAKSDKNFILVKGDVPIMLVAHLDTVHKEPVRDICSSLDRNIFMSPQGIGGDDRCGVYALVNAYEMSVKKPYLLFTCNEEVGGIGADYFCQEYIVGALPKELEELKCIVEIDRKGSKDAVYYDCDNGDFENYITSKGFKTAYGSFSDISYIAPELGVAAVNLSSGYYNAHQLCEYINLRELNWTLDKVIEIIADAAKEDFPKYEYIERKTFFHNSDWNYIGGYDKINGIKVRETQSATLEDELDEIKPMKKEDELYYYELIDGNYYNIEDLEFFREHYGDNIIRELYIEAFKPFVEEDFSSWRK